MSHRAQGRRLELVTAMLVVAAAVVTVTGRQVGEDAGSRATPDVFIVVPNQPQDLHRDTVDDTVERPERWHGPRGHELGTVFVTSHNVGPLARTVRFNDGFLDEAIKDDFLTLGLGVDGPDAPTPAFAHFQGDADAASIIRFRFEREQQSTAVLVIDVDTHDQVSIRTDDRDGSPMTTSDQWTVAAAGDFTVPSGVLGATGPDPAIPPAFDPTTATLRSAQPGGEDSNRSFTLLIPNQPYQELELQLSDDRGADAARDSDGNLAHHVYYVLVDTRTWSGPAGQP